ncbi:MAG: electron transfer flavoprotein subunit beta/FixA family protein [Chloroflexi bacterium]|nr:electron transfer flavoprotein subunit beta/FixA family protein [Chloroflexota bacterium]MBI3763273.1 electron transfer flavoprotein subunit beta/FixA family protein [Chloroflexota bacterium]
MLNAVATGQAAFSFSFIEEAHLNIVVCIKQTPDTAAKVEVKDGHVTWGDSPLVVNPWDEFAVEEAIRLKEKHGGKVIAISLGPETAREALKQAVAMGSDEAYLVSDPVLKGSDVLATSRALAKAIGKIDGVDLVLFGKQAIDGDTGQTAIATARRLGWSPLTYVAKIAEIDPAARTIKVERLLEEGRQTVTSKLPAVISVVKEINEPRYPSFMGIRKASKLAIPIWSAADIGVEAGQVGLAGSGVAWPEIMPLPAREAVCEFVEGASPAEVAAKLADKLAAEKVV